MRETRGGLDSLRQLSDEELARAAARGDEPAARVLLERFEEPLHRYTVALVRDADLAREATWSALFEAARAVRAGEYTEPIAPWIFRVAHTAADVAGGRPESARADLAVVADPDDEPATRAAVEGAPDWARLDALLVGIDALPDRDRSSFLLRELVGLEYVGIATVTGARAAAARQSVFRARKSLQGDIEPPTPYCMEIQAAMSKAETGIRERRSIALHLETCAVCEAFASQLESRPDDLQTLFPAPVEPLAAELLPPLPPAPPAPTRRGWGGLGGRGPGGRGPSGRGPAGRGRGGRRRGALVPLVLALLLVGAAIATALALNDNGGGKKGRAAAAGGAQARGAAGGNGSAKSSGHAGKAKPHAAGKPQAAKKPHAAKKPPPAKPHQAKPSQPKAAAPGSGSSKGTGSQSKGGEPSKPSEGTQSGAGGAQSGQGSGHAKQGAPCRTGPVASPAQSGYGNQAGVAQATVEPCDNRADESGGLANTGLDVALVIATAALLLALGASLRRLGTQA